MKYFLKNVHYCQVTHIGKENKSNKWRELSEQLKLFELFKKSYIYL